MEAAKIKRAKIARAVCAREISARKIFATCASGENILTANISRSTVYIFDLCTQPLGTGWYTRIYVSMAAA